MQSTLTTVSGALARTIILNALIASFGLQGMYETGNTFWGSWRPGFYDSRTQEIDISPHAALYIWFCGFALVGCVSNIATVEMWLTAKMSHLWNKSSRRTPPPKIPDTRTFLPRGEHSPS